MSESGAKQQRDGDPPVYKKRKITNQNITDDQTELLHPKIPYRLACLLADDDIDDNMKEDFLWNSADKSYNMVINGRDHRICVRSPNYPINDTTDCVRGKTGLSSGLHVWQITWAFKQRGSHAMIGVATKEAPLTCTGFRSLVGSNKESWGWDLGRNELRHDSNPPKPFPINNNGYLPSDSIKVVLDMDAGTLSFIDADEEKETYLGQAFDGLKGLTLYPIVSAVWGGCQIKMEYIKNCSLLSKYCLIVHQIFGHKLDFPLDGRLIFHLLEPNTFLSQKFVFVIKKFLCLEVYSLKELSGHTVIHACSRPSSPQQYHNNNRRTMGDPFKKILTSLTLPDVLKEYLLERSDSLPCFTF